MARQKQNLVMAGTRGHIGRQVVFRSDYYGGSRSKVLARMPRQGSELSVSQIAFREAAAEAKRIQGQFVTEASHSKGSAYQLAMRWLMQGQPDRIPDGLATYNFANQTDLVMATLFIPAGAATYNFGNTRLYGDVANIPAGATKYYFSYSNVSGDISGIPSGAGLYWFDSTNISGELAGSPAGAANATYWFHNTSIGGDIANAPAFGRAYVFRNSNVSGSDISAMSGAAQVLLQDTQVDPSGIIRSAHSLRATWQNCQLNVGGSNPPLDQDALDKIGDLQLAGWTVIYTGS